MDNTNAPEHLKLCSDIDRIFESHCLLFLGSGFSIGAENVAGTTIPTASGLKEILEQETGLQAADLGQAAEDYIETIGEYRLAPLIQRLFSTARPTDRQLEIASCVWKRVYTTNYDDVFEYASRQHKRALTPITPSADIRDYQHKSDIVVHINGSVHNILPSRLSDEVKLADRSYNSDRFSATSWGNLFKFDLKDADAVFFIGFSLAYDLDLRRIISEQDIREKTHFIVSENESEPIIRKISHYGHVHPIGLDSFAKLVMERKKSYTPRPMTLRRPLLCFHTFQKAESRPRINDDLVNDLLFCGRADADVIQYCIHEPAETDYLYYIRRKEQRARILNLIEQGARNIAIHSDLGNGKTLFIKGLAAELDEKGYRVISFTRSRASLEREIEQICSNDKNTVFIVENYGRYSDVLQMFACHRSNQILIVTERSAIHELRYDALTEIIGEELMEVDINKLSKDDRQDIIQIFNKFGLWRKKASLLPLQKDQYIQNDCHNSLRGVLLGLLRSPHILKRFDNLVNTMKEKTDFYETVVLVMLNSLFELNLDLDMIANALDSPITNNPRFKRNESVKEIIDFKGAGIRVHSALLAEVLLGKVINKETVKNVLIKMFKNFDRLSDNRDYRRVLQIIILYTNLRRALDSEDPGVDYKDIMISFFEEIRDTHFCKNNPHYWLQYAILRLDAVDLDVALSYFETAYSLAKRYPDYDTYQIDNHFARYLLERGKTLDKDSPYMDYFTRAHKILTDPNHKKDTKYYPFKMAQLYEPFFENHAAHLTAKDRGFIKQSCKEILALMESYLTRVPDHRTHPAVKDAEKALNRILQKIG